MEPKHMSWWVCQQCGQWVDDFLHGCQAVQIAQAEAAQKIAQGDWAIQVVHDEVVWVDNATDSSQTITVTGIPPNPNMTIYYVDAQGNVIPQPNIQEPPETPPRPRHAFVDNTGWRNAWAYCVEVRKKSRLFDKEWWGDWDLTFWAPPYAFKTREACDRRRAEFERAAVSPQDTEFRSEPRYFGYDVTTALWYREDWVTILPCHG